MKLKLQIWKTDKAVAVSVLECEGIPVNRDRGNAIRVSSYGCTQLLDDGEMVLNIHETGMIDTIKVDNPREYIYNLTKNITRELFAPKKREEKREVKVGDVVRSTNGNKLFTVLHILPEKYRDRYVITDEHNVTYTVAGGILVKDAQITFTKEITDVIETYTWEI